jgi:hypothetical protein
LGPSAIDLVVWLSAGLGFGQQAQQQYLQPQPRLHAEAKLLLASLELGLPVEQARLAD